MPVGGCISKACYYHFAPLLWALLIPLIGHSEQLPLKTYTTADGLARDQINRIVRDSRGFLWFATPEGLSRFDGYRFTSYTINRGLPDRQVNDLLETRDGRYWVATGDGLCLFNPAGVPQTRIAMADTAAATLPMFVTYHPDEDKAARYVTALVEDHSGTIWCGTAQGLYRLEESNGMIEFEAVDVGMPAARGDARLIETILEDRNGTLWIGTGVGLYRRSPDGRAQRYAVEQGLPDNFVQALLEDSEGRLWAGTRFGGLCQITYQPGASALTITRVGSMKDGLPSRWITTLFESSDKKLWVGTNAGFSEMVAANDARGWQFKNYAMAEGLSDREVWALAEDRDGSLWLGMLNGGAQRLARNGFITYGKADGLGNDSISAIFENRAGELCVMTTSGRERRLNHLDGRRFIARQPGLPAQAQPFDWGWGWNQIVLQDHGGDWWLATGQGLYRYAKTNGVEQLASARPKAIYTAREGLGGNNAFRLFEDSHGDIWVSLFDTSTLTRWERATGTFHRFSVADGIPQAAATAFCEDVAGDLWIGFYGGGLARYRDGRFTLFTETDGLPAGMIRSLHLDQRRRLWVGSGGGGLVRLDDPTADHPRMVSYTMGEGLSSNDVWCITEDRWGHMYAGTGRGLDCLDPQSGHVIHYTEADGLARGRVEVAFYDRRGVLWFGTSHGLSRLLAELDRPLAPPPVVISGLRIAGVARRVSELGEMNLSGFTLEPGQNDVQIDFVGLGFGPGRGLRYQYKLEGADADWGALTDQRTVNYANLAPGTYRFVVQAMSADGMISAAPAAVAFTILRPVWQRWWFLLIAAMASGLMIYAAHRRRLARLIEMERVRTRIATDLHDDIGSSLSRRAILSEVVRRQFGGAAQEAVPMLTEMAESSRGLLDSMSDIVWSIDPRRDHLSDLARRIRQFASDVFEARQIAWDLQIPQEFDRVRLNAAQRRQVFLIFKEAVNNIARHAGCSAARLNVRIAHHQLIAEIHDNGCGFDLSAMELSADADSNGGHGLESMQRRAAQIGGRLDIHSAPGNGTALKLTIPLNKS